MRYAHMEDDLMIRQPKIAIVGAGLVGGSAALFAAYAIPGAEVLIIDVEPTRAEGQAFDIAHAAALWRAARVSAGDYEDAAGADIVVLTAGAAMKPGQTRLDLAKGNVQILRQIIERVGPVAPEAIYVIATNPVDVLVRVARDLMRLPRERVISTGTALDTARLQTLLSERLGVVPASIHAYVLGEHGDSALIHWSGASIAGMPLDTFLERTGKELGPASRDLLTRSVHESAKVIKEGKGATHYGIASAVARICQAIVHDSDLVLPVGVVQPEVEGVPEVCVSMPMVLGSTGAQLIAYPVLNDVEREELRRSAQIIEAATADVLSVK
jgi:L-lactate dehydrogenase